MKIFVVGAGQVGSTIVEALHDEHDLTVIDTVSGAAEALAYRFDVRTIEGNGASRRTLAGGGRRRRGPLHRVHVARRGEPRRLLLRPPGGAEGDDGDPDVQRRVHRPLARRPARRRLRGLLRARDGARDLAGRSACRPRGRPTCSPTARCRSSSSRSPRAPSPSVVDRPAPRRPHPGRIAGARHHPRGRDDASAGRRRDLATATGSW